MLIIEDSEWIVLDATPTNVVITTSSSNTLSSASTSTIPSSTPTSTLTHRNPTYCHTKDETATTTDTTTTTASTKIPHTVADLESRIRHLCDTMQTCRHAWKNHKQHRSTSRVYTSMQRLRIWFHHITTRDWRQIIRWLYVPYPKLCDGFFYFIVIGMCLLSFLSLIPLRISCLEFLAKPALIAMGLWITAYMLLIFSLFIGHTCAAARGWRSSVYIIPIPATHVIPYTRTTLALFITLMCFTLHPIGSIRPFHNAYAYVIVRTWVIVMLGYPVWRGWYDVRANMETLHTYYTGMGDIIRLQVTHAPRSTVTASASASVPASTLVSTSTSTSISTSTSTSTSTSETETNVSINKSMDPAAAATTFTAVPLSKTIPTLRSTLAALFSQVYHYCCTSISPSPPTPSHVSLFQLHLTQCLTCGSIAMYSMIVGGVLIGHMFQD